MRPWAVVALVVLLSGCGAAAGPDGTQASAPRAAGRPRLRARCSRTTTTGTPTSRTCRATRAASSGRRGCHRTSMLHPDFGPSYGDGPNYGMPVTVVDARSPRVRVRFGYADESDRVRYPFGRDTAIEGGRNSPGDKHAIVVDRGTCRLYETWNTTVRDGRWRAGSGATWFLDSNDLRPDGWTSADAAGLPILPGLLRWREVRDRDGRPRDPVHHRRDRHAGTSGRPATTPAPATATSSRRWVPGSGSRPATSPTGTGRRCPRGGPRDEDLRPGAGRQRQPRGSSRASATDAGRIG